MAYETATSVNRPPPVSDETRARWDCTRVPHAMLNGTWTEHAERRLHEFFDDEPIEFMPRSVTSICLLRTFTEQTSTLYDGAVTVHAGEISDESRAMLGLDLLWAQQQQTLEYVRGLNDALLLRSWDDERQRVRYLPVAPDCVEAWPDPDDASQPITVHHHRRRTIGTQEVWCRDVWDRAAAQFRIEAWSVELDPETGVQVGDGRWADVTLDLQPDLGRLPGNWPWWTNPPPAPPETPEEVDAYLASIAEWDYGEPIWPWTAYHHRVGWKLFDAWYNGELVDLTLLVACMLTFGTCGARDLAFEQRGLIDGQIGGTPTATPAGVMHTATSPLKVLMIKSTESTKQAVMGSWRTPFDMKAFFATIGQLMTLGAMAAGLSGADVSTSEAGLSRVSGEAITVSRSGQRKIEKKMVKPMSLGDAHNLAGAAALATAYGGAVLPLDPEAYDIVYAETPRTIEEIKAEVDEITETVAAGLLHPADGLRRLQPHLTREEAETEVLAIADFKRELERAAEPEPAEDTGPTDPAAEPATDTLVEGAAGTDGTQPLAATALNGAQVTAAMDSIVLKYLAGQISRESAGAALEIFFQIRPEDAARVLGPVGWKPAPIAAPPPFSGPPAPPEPDSTTDDEDAASAA